MKPVKTTYGILYNRFSAGLLLLLFVSTWIMQVMHTHNANSLAQMTDGIEQIMTFDNTCAVCDYIAHNHQEAYTTVHSVTITVPLPKEVELHNGVFARIYKFTLQGFTNKGPPAALAV